MASGRGSGWPSPAWWATSPTFPTRHGAEVRTPPAAGEKCGYDFDVEFDVESYLRHQGEASRAIRRELAALPDEGARLLRPRRRPGARSPRPSADSSAKFLLMTFSSDWLYPPCQLRAVDAAIGRAAGDATYREIPSDYGHDAFLLEHEQQEPLVRAFLGEGDRYNPCRHPSRETPLPCPSPTAGTRPGSPSSRRRLRRSGRVTAAGWRRQTSGAGHNTPKARPDPRLDWWREARFGMFIHWGLYAVPGGRVERPHRLRRVDPQQREDPARRVRPVPATVQPGEVRRRRLGAHGEARPGMQYIVITTKHHDGFACSTRSGTTWDVMATPFERDIIARAGRRVPARAASGSASTTRSWTGTIPTTCRGASGRADRPAAGADFERYVAFMKAPAEGTADQLRPDRRAVVRRRVGRHLDATSAGGTSTHYVRRAAAGDHRQQPRRRGPCGDFGTPEQEIPATGLPGVDWETCMTMNGNWGYNRADKNCKSDEDPGAQAGRHRVEGRQLPAERRADRRRRLPGGKRRAPAGDRRVDARQRRVDPRHLGQPVSVAAWGRCTQRRSRRRRRGSTCTSSTGRPTAGWSCPACSTTSCARARSRRLTSPTIFPSSARGTTCTSASVSSRGPDRCPTR